MNYKGHLVKPSKNPDGNPCFRIYSTQAKDKLIGEAPSLSLALKEIDRLTEGQSFKPNPFRQALNESSLKSNLGDKPQIDDEKPRKEWLLTVQQCGEIFGLP
ncbi:MAG TPA: hypothetical protein VN944_12365, partial [Nitrospiria bacterium]|nr:hypothetical protein [Nitrospiria bacterium]